MKPALVLCPQWQRSISSRLACISATQADAVVPDQIGLAVHRAENPMLPSVLPISVTRTFFSSSTVNASCGKSRGGRRALAPGAGFEPATNRLTAGCSTAELSGINALRAYRRAVMHASPVAGLIVRTAVIKQWSNMPGAHVPGDDPAFRLFADDRLQVPQACCYRPFTRP
jgi:hypothetical protein